MSNTTRRAALRAAMAWPLALLLPSARAEQVDVPALLAGAQAAGGIEEGAGNHRLYVFYDPNCPYCHRLYKALRAPVAQGRVRVSWITLGYLTATSGPKAAAILQSADPVAALAHNENDYDFADDGQPGGGIVGARTIAPATQARLDRNLALYRRHKLYGVPVLVWKGSDGNAHMMAGSPTETELRQILSSLD